MTIVAAGPAVPPTPALPPASSAVRPAAATPGARVVDDAPPFDVARATKVGDENGTAYLRAPAWVWFGANGRFLAKRFPAGPVVLTRDVFGGDPAEGVVKAGYVVDAGAVAPIPTATGAALLDGEPAPRDGGWFPGTQLLPDPALPATPLGRPMPLLVRRARVVPPGFVPSPPNGRRADPVPIAPGSPLVTFPGSAIRASIPDIAGGFFEIWTDGAFFFGARKFRAWAAGGHGGGNEVAVIETDLDAMRSRRCFPDVPTPIVVDVAHGDRAPLPPMPQAVHHYGTQVATTDPLQNGREVLFKFGTTPDPTIFDADRDGWVERLPRLNDNTTGALAVGDPKRGFVWLQVTGPTNLLYHYDLASRRLFAHGGNGTPESWKGGPGGLTDDDRLWQIVAGTNPDNSAANDHAWLSMTPLADVIANPALGRGPFVRIPAWGIPTNFTADYDARRRRWIIHAPDPANPAQGRWWALDRDTLKLTDLATGGQPPARNGTWGRMRIDPVRDMAITVASEAKDFYGLRLGP